MLVVIFLPYSRVVSIVLSSILVLLYSMFIIFDTYMIFNRMSEDEWVLGAVNLYLDFANLFLAIAGISTDS
ncbi:hypothetical protein HK102_010147 [Quaeritorhiza haematococci]|nr:hypothetical protein HK102_010147 [Quaeritorhiza haematococci]